MPRPMLARRINPDKRYNPVSTRTRYPNHVIQFHRPLALADSCWKRMCFINGGPRRSTFPPWHLRGWRVCRSDTPKIFSPFGSHSRPYRLPCHDEKKVIDERILFSNCQPQLPARRRSRSPRAWSLLPPAAWRKANSLVSCQTSFGRVVEFSRQSPSPYTSVLGRILSGETAAILMQGLEHG